MNLKMRKVTTIQIEGEGVLNCPIHRWRKPVIAYNGKLFKCGCPGHAMFESENLYKAVYGWNSSILVRYERITRGDE